MDRGQDCNDDDSEDQDTDRWQGPRKVASRMKSGSIQYLIVNKRQRIKSVRTRTSYVQTMVERYARMWLEHANLQLEFVQNSNADIRISFNTGSSWSYVSTNRSVPFDR